MLPGLLQETSVYIYLGFSKTPCSAAVRAQHMELTILVSQDPPQSLQNPIFRPRCLPRGSKVAPKRPPSSILEFLGLDLEASRLDLKASRARFSSYFGSTGPKKEDMYFLSDASTFGCWLFDLQFSVFVFCCLPCSNALRESLPSLKRYKCIE